jgi:hypothetical protein
VRFDDFSASLERLVFGCEVVKDDGGGRTERIFCLNAFPYGNHDAGGFYKNEQIYCPTPVE